MRHIILLVALSCTQLFAQGFTCQGDNGERLTYSSLELRFTSDTWNFKASGPNNVYVLGDANDTKTVNAFEQITDRIYHGVLFDLPSPNAYNFYLSVKLAVVSGCTYRAQDVLMQCFRS
ncbi:MAG: hypothetical protein JKY15_06415 [Deltaproteobacteria bacterium]|nr:hypothetical protein [Deltaproteobacteria bacterium]